jgi:hypothetical protein
MPRRPSIWKQIIRATAFALLAAVTMLVLAVSWVSYQGRLDWARTKAELLAKGEKLTQVELIPPPIPDEDNLFADPVWKAVEGSKPPKTAFQIANTPLTPSEFGKLNKISGNYFDGSHGPDRRTTAAKFLLLLTRDRARLVDQKLAANYVLEILQPLDSYLDRAHQLLGRPDAQYPIDMAKWITSPTSYLGPYPAFQDIAAALSSEAYSHLLLGDSRSALSNILDVLRLAQIPRHDPLLFSQELRMGMLVDALAPIRLGLSMHVWTESDLAHLEKTLDSINLIPGVALGCRGQRGLVNQLCEQYSKSPNHENALTLLRYYFPTFLSQEEAGPRRWALTTFARPVIAIFGARFQARLNRYVQRIIDICESTPQRGCSAEDLTILTRSSRPSHNPFDPSPELPIYVAASVGSTLDLQTRIRQAVVVCALERYRLKYKDYPGALAELMPDFISAIPRDLYTREPMHYRRESPDSFNLWVVPSGPGTERNWDHW